jgi:hypothetical protein
VDLPQNDGLIWSGREELASSLPFFFCHNPGNKRARYPGNKWVRVCSIAGLKNLAISP